MSSNGKERSTSPRPGSKPASRGSSKHASSESVLSRKERESLQMQECKRQLLAAPTPHVIVRDDNVVLRSPPQKKIVMPPTVNPEELAASTPTQRNWRGILIALLVIAAVLGLIVFSIALLTPAGDGGRLRGRTPTLHALASLAYKPFNGTWLSDETLAYRDRWGGLTLLHARNLTTRLLLANSTFRELNAVDFKVSADLKYVMLISDVRPGWKYGRLARYHVYDVINRNKIPVSAVEDDRSAPLLQYAEWAPVGSALVFVQDNDIYYKPRVLKPLVCRITNTGVPGVIFNGVPDFLYETEVLQLGKALWFSGDAQALLYATYNDSLVAEHRYPWYGLDRPEPPAYPSVRSLRYPKVNTANPAVALHVVSLRTPKFLFPHQLQLPPNDGQEWYVRWAAWAERAVAVLLLNRAQNVSIIALCSATSYNCTDIYRDEVDDSRWSGLGAEPEDEECGWCGGAALLPTREGGIITSLPVGGQPGEWRHAVRVTRDAAAPLTQGVFEVSQLLGYDERRRLLYVMGTAPDKPGERHLYRVREGGAGGEWPEPPACLTCPGPRPSLTATDSPDDTNDDDLEAGNVTAVLGTWPTAAAALGADNDSLPEDCLFSRITFSHNFSFYVHECLGPGPPAYYLAAGDGGRRAVLWDGQPVRARAAALAHPTPKVFRVEVQPEREARVRLLLPPGFRETDDLPLPLLLHVSATPGSQLVSERWSADWAWYLSARGLLVAQVDARGAAGRGLRLRTALRHRLWQADVDDQLAVLTYLRDKLRMVDGARVGAWGAGYGGGAAAALAAADAANVTRCLALVAPLTDLRLHNSYWTERYSGSGAAAAGALGATAAWRRAGNLPPRRLLLASATADLRAPPPHALLLARALVAADAVYSHQVYPDEGHNFERSSTHLLRSVEQFFTDCLAPAPPAADWPPDPPHQLFPFQG